MWVAYVAFPAYRAKDGHVNTFAERLQGCFRFSLNGKAPPLGDPVLVALETYSYFLARGLPTGEDAPGRGYSRLPKPERPADFARGAQVYTQRCAMCHGPQGLGVSAGGSVVFPPL
jgi:thiosulfate dehydrogenase